MRKFGIRMDGNELAVESLFLNYFKNTKENSFYYLEIGAAGGRTLKSIYDICSENLTSNWSVVGLDLVGGYSLDLSCIKNLFGDKISIEYSDFDQKPRNARLVLKTEPREWTSSLPDSSIDICLIDASHGQPSVTADFLSVESKIKPNGLVLFHDFCVLSQGTDWQGVDGEFINVRKACRDLGLIDNQRSNWKLEGEILGTRFSGGEGNGIGVFRKCINQNIL